MNRRAFLALFVAAPALARKPPPPKPEEDRPPKAPKPPKPPGKEKPKEALPDPDTMPVDKYNRYKRPRAAR